MIRRQLKKVEMPATSKKGTDNLPPRPITSHDYGEREKHVRRPETSASSTAGSEQEDMGRKIAVDNQKRAMHRLEQRLRSSADSLKPSLELMDASGEGRVGYTDFKSGLRGGGVILGEADYRAAWEYAGGGGESDKISLQPFFQSITSTHEAAGGRANTATGANRRLSQLQLGSLKTTEEAKLVSERYGKSPNASKNTSKGVIQPDPLDELGGGLAPRVLNKWEISVKETLQKGKEAVKRTFGVGAGGDAGRALDFGEFQAAVQNAGVRLGKSDIESVWRKADKECLGRVTYGQLASTFGLSDYVVKDEPGCSNFLPHFRSQAGGGGVPDVGGGEHQGVLERTGTGRLTRERIGHSVLVAGGAGAVVKKLESLLGGSGKKIEEGLQAGELRRALCDAGAVVSEADATSLVEAAGKDGRPGTGREVIEALKGMEGWFDPKSNESVIGFGTRHLPAAERGGNGQQQHHQPAAGGAIAERVARSQIGNPHRLRQVFRQIDIDRSGTLSNTEFLHALSVHGVPLTAAEGEAICSASDPAGRGVVSYESFISSVYGGEVGSAQARNQAEGIMGSRSTPAAGSMTSRREERQQHMGKRRAQAPTVHANPCVPERSTASFAGGSSARKDERSAWLNEKPKTAPLSRGAEGTYRVLRMSGGPPPPPPSKA